MAAGVTLMLAAISFLWPIFAGPVQSKIKRRPLRVPAAMTGKKPGSIMASATYKELLGRNKHFRSLWIGQMISELGTWFSFIAELGLVRTFSGSPLATTALLVAKLLPFLLVAPIAGVLADRRSRKHLLVAADLIRALLALLFLIAAKTGAVWMVVATSALMSSVTMFFEAAKNAAIPNLVSGRELLTANVLMFSTRFLQYTLGSAIGGLTAAQFGYDVSFITNAASFVLSALFIIPIPRGLMRQRPARPEMAAAAVGTEIQLSDPLSAETAAGLPIAGSEEPSASSGSHFWSDIREGLRFIWATPFVRGLILVNIAWATGGGMTNVLFDRVAGHVFSAGAGDRGDWVVATLFTASGAGVFLGMLLSRRVGQWMADERRASHFIGWALIFHGLLFATSGAMPTLALMAGFVCASRLVLGAEFGVQETMMMRVLPDDYRGRVFTTDRSLEWATMALSTTAAGWMLRWIDPRSLMIVAGFLAASPGLAWLSAVWLASFRVPSKAVRESYGD
jgi:MFS family permease